MFLSWSVTDSMMARLRSPARKSLTSAPAATTSPTIS
jgi:hypothetical protein